MLNRIAIANNFGKGKIKKSHLEKIERLLSAFERTEDIAIDGLTPERQDLLAPGLCIMLAIMDALAIDSFKFSPTALREGMLREITSHRVDYHLDD
jgi:exopolyphosphatase/guanosine-5'-triphosphate,3'-diphosphate pyrophosphatase